VSKVNVFDDPDLAARYGINAVPQIFFFKSNDRPFDRLVGLQSEQKLTEVLDRLLGS
jgi:thioredoxin-like negative regulator of GroEL